MNEHFSTLVSPNLIHTEIDRLVEDLAATLPLFRERHSVGRPILPSAALLACLGRAYLHAGGRIEAFPFAEDDRFVAISNAWLWPIGLGEVNLSYFLAAIVFARPDVWLLSDQSIQGGQIDWPRSLQWLILHGARELGLYPFFHKSFIITLNSETVRLGAINLTPLQMIVARERPELVTRFGGMHKVALDSVVRHWLENECDENLAAVLQSKSGGRKPRLSEVLKSKIRHRGLKFSREHEER